MSVAYFISVGSCGMHLRNTTTNKGTATHQRLSWTKALTLKLNRIDNRFHWIIWRIQRTITADQLRAKFRNWKKIFQILFIIFSFKKKIPFNCHRMNWGLWAFELTICRWHDVWWSFWTILWNNNVWRPKSFAQSFRSSPNRWHRNSNVSRRLHALST